MANNKKTIVPLIVLLFLGILMYGVTHFNAAGLPPDGLHEKNKPLVPSDDVLAKRWPEILSHATAPARGNPKTPYTIAEFGDFECPQCGKVRPMIEQMLAKYPDEVNLIFVHRPFPTLHQWALQSAQASEVAAAQGKFWPMYDQLYSHQDDLEPGFYPNYAVKIGLDKDQFNTAYNSAAPQQAVKTASAFSDDLGVDVTPTLVVHDNIHGTVTTYTGLKPQDPSRVHPGDLYVDTDLVNHPPWMAQQKSTASAK